MLTVQLRLSALNSTKTAYSSFALDADAFFEDYSFSIGRDASTSGNVRPDRFCCQIYLKVRHASGSSVVVDTH